MIHKNMEGGSISFDGFAGMDASTPFGAGKALLLKNFRLLSDGSLEKREGYRHLATLSDVARGSYLLNEGGEQALLLVAGSKLYRVSLDDGQVKSASVFSRTEGNVTFLPMEDALYLLDGNRLYRYDGGVAVTAGQAYQAVGGTNWPIDSMTPTKIEESPNLLTGLLSYEYEGAERITFLHLATPVEEVISLHIGQTLIPSREYYLSEDRKTIHMKAVWDGFYRPVYVTVKAMSNPDILTSRSCFSYERGGEKSLLLYGGEEGRVYESRRPTGGGEGFPVYFTSDGEWQVEGGAVQSLCRVGKQTLIASEDGLRLTKEVVVANQPPAISTVTTDIGCSAPDGVVAMDEETLLVVGGGGVYRVQIDPSLQKECVIKLISKPIESAMGQDFLTAARVCRDPASGEVWFADPSGKGEVFLYRPDGEYWRIYDGIRADRLWSVGGRTVFLDGHYLNAFAADAKADEAAYGTQEIMGVFKSHYLDFGKPESDKRLSGLLVLAALDGGALEVRASDGGYLAEFTVGDNACPTFPYLYEKHLHSGRFRFASFELRAAGAVRQRIFGAKVFV